MFTCEPLSKKPENNLPTSKAQWSKERIPILKRKNNTKQGWDQARSKPSKASIESCSSVHHAGQFVAMMWALAIFRIPVPMTLLALAYMTSLFNWLFLLSWISPADVPHSYILHFLGFPLYLQLHLTAKFSHRNPDTATHHLTSKTFHWNQDGNFLWSWNSCILRNCKIRIMWLIPKSGISSQPHSFIYGLRSYGCLNGWTWGNHFLINPV